MKNFRWKGSAACQADVITKPSKDYRHHEQQGGEQEQPQEQKEQEDQQEQELRQEQQEQQLLREHQQPSRPMTGPSTLRNDHESHEIVTKRMQVRGEIISSEETYVRELRTLVTVFLRPLGKWVAEGMDGLKIPVGSLSRIFSSTEGILTFHELFLRALAGGDAGSEGGGGGGESEGIGAKLKRQPLDIAEPYSLYVKLYPQAMKSLAACEEFSEFKAFIRACEHQDVCHGLDLRAYLIQPVQRIPRYRLLFIELLKHTDESHPDWADLNFALEHMSRTADRLNEGARDQERFLRALELQYEFREDFLTPSSHLVKEGDLTRVGNGGSRRYKFVLLSDMLVYGTETMRAKLQKDHLEYKVRGRIPLHECMVLDYGSHDSFALVPSGGKSFVVTTASEGERDAWLEAFAEGFDEIGKRYPPDKGDEVSQQRLQQRLLVKGYQSGSGLNPTPGDGRRDLKLFDTWSVGSTRRPEGGECDGDRDIGDAKAAELASTEGGDGDRECAALSPPQRRRRTLAGGGLAQTVSASMMAAKRRGLAAAAVGTGVGAMLPFGSHTGVNEGSASLSPSERSSLGRLSSHRVQVWMRSNGRTELQQICLAGLPPAVKSGIFKVPRPEASIPSPEARRHSAGWSRKDNVPAESSHERKQSVSGQIASNRPGFGKRNTSRTPKPDAPRARGASSERGRGEAADRNGETTDDDAGGGGGTGTAGREWISTGTTQSEVVMFMRASSTDENGSESGSVSTAEGIEVTTDEEINASLGLGGGGGKPIVSDSEARKLIAALPARYTKKAGREAHQGVYARGVARKLPPPLSGASRALDANADSSGNIEKSRGDQDTTLDGEDGDKPLHLQSYHVRMGNDVSDGEAEKAQVNPMMLGTVFSTTLVNSQPALDKSARTPGGDAGDEACDTKTTAASSRKKGMESLFAYSGGRSGDVAHFRASIPASKAEASRWPLLFTRQSKLTMATTERGSPQNQRLTATNSNSNDSNSSSIFSRSRSRSRGRSSSRRRGGSRSNRSSRSSSMSSSRSSSRSSRSSSSGTGSRSAIPGRRSWTLESLQKGLTRRMGPRTRRGNSAPPLSGGRSRRSPGNMDNIVASIFSRRARNIDSGKERCPGADTSMSEYDARRREATVVRLG